MIWHYDHLSPGLIAKDPTHKRFSEAPFDVVWRPLQGDFSALSNYLMDLAWDVLQVSTWPSSKRPRLRLSRSEDTKKQARNRRAKQKARGAPRSPSLA
jgi:hypothetical protein